MLSFVPTPLGTIEDITVRTLKIFESADSVFCEDTRITRSLFQILNDRSLLNHKNPKFISFHSHNEDEVIATLTPQMFEQNIVFVSDAGMPCISDPGAKLVRYAIDHHIPYDVLPGGTAATTAFAMSGFLETRFLFFGFLPHKGKERHKELQKALSYDVCVIMYESPHRIEKFFQDLLSHAPTRPLFAVREMTKRYETRYWGTASSILERLQHEQTKGEWCIIIGPNTDPLPHTLTQEEILAMDIPTKEKAKRIADLTGESVKACYNRLNTLS